VESRLWLSRLSAPAASIAAYWPGADFPAAARARMSRSHEPKDRTCRAMRFSSRKRVGLLDQKVILRYSIMLVKV
jgi:hypothetical protein